MPSKYYNLDTDSQFTANSDYYIPSQKAIKTALSNYLITKKFNNITVPITDFVEDTTYSQYPYKADITLEGVTATMIPDVYFNGADALSGNYAPIAILYDGYLRIFSKSIPSSDLIIEAILCQ